MKKTIKYLSLLCFVGLASACVTAKPALDKAQKQEALAPAKKLFSKSTYKPSSKTERKIYNILTYKLEKFLKTRDVSYIKPYLSKNFAYIFNSGKNTAKIEKKSDFLKTRNNWKKFKVNANLGIQAIKASKNSAVAVALLETKTKFFNPKSLETITFVKENSSWKISKIASNPLTPSDFSLLDATIFVAKPTKDEKGLTSVGNFIKHFNENALEIGADNILSSLEKVEVKNGSGFSRPPVKADIIVAFKEPLLLKNAGVTTKIKANCGKTIRVFNKVSSVSPYMIVASQAVLQSCVDKFDVKVEIANQTITSKTFYLNK